MTPRRRPPNAARAIAGARIGAAAVCIAVLGYAYALRVSVGDGSAFDFFGYFTNQTSLLTSVVLVGTGAIALRGRRVPDWLSTARGIAVACLVVVALVYNLLVPGTGSAPPWVSALLHLVFPVAVVLDWMLVADRPALPWRRLWLVLPYPIAWLVVVLARGVTDGWVPYGFLLLERGLPSLVAHVVGLLAALLAAGALVWAASRLRVFTIADAGPPTAVPSAPPAPSSARMPRG
ncbi:Pr6Pr family membrane protein [Agromyces sp. S2-1-8]|uniref:Pr6Pr family membrane protein n=1 Tax=Agromyces sp. S2-1-8 TaxID=2897180 RepID=UPI001E5002DF|nr:Pr6Pr family membrane protein [Agromyces sp. S2-1-8]MCD5345330.1 Pr6Pr family membrane protein [Agromyces sp. S2-1-8]